MEHGTTSTAPSDEDRKRFKNAIMSLLTLAIKIELSTIPLYLYSIYSIKKDDGEGGTQARAKISVVVHQEMLHLALAGNLLTSIESGPQLYSDETVPTYGGPDDVILKSGIPLRLEPCEKDNLECFLKIEAPYLAPPTLTAEEESVNAADANLNLYRLNMSAAKEYHSIGELYTELEDMIHHCEDYITFGNEDLQFSPADFFADKMTQVVNQKTAHHALKIIIDQGEGSVGVEDAHYQMFLELYMNRTDWKCWQVPKSPKTTDYESDPLLWNLARASDAAYCYLLVTIQKTWEVKDLVLRRSLIANIHSIMVNIITPLADLMVAQPFKNGSAAPAFQIYKTGAEGDKSKVDEAGKKLQEAIINHLESAINAAQGNVKEALNVIKFSAQRISWPTR